MSHSRLSGGRGDACENAGIPGSEIAMSATPSAQPPSPRRPRIGLSRRALLLVALAFAAGLALFLLLWLDKRNDADFFRAGGTPAPGAPGQAFEPLPTPEAAGGTRETRPAADGTGEKERGIATPDASREDLADADAPPEFAPLPPPPAPPEAAASAGPDASARPISSPQPRYPARAMRRGESGTVLLQVSVDAEGRPVEVGVVQSSRSRDLDREAQRTVERWRFSPAIRNGRAVASKVLVPIEFRP